jgi:hypothetical protein
LKEDYLLSEGVLFCNKHNVYVDLQANLSLVIIIFKLTVEDPSDEFQRLRDFVDSRNCSRLPSFQACMLQEGFQEDMAAEAKTKLKINKVFIHVFILLLKYTVQSTRLVRQNSVKKPKKSLWHSTSWPWLRSHCVLTTPSSEM